MSINYSVSLSKSAPAKILSIKGDDPSSISPQMIKQWEANLNSQLILEEINKARDGYNSLFTMYISLEDTENQRCYKRMLDNQRKSLEELIKMYRKAKETELETAQDARWAERDAALSASSRGDRHKDFVDEDDE